MIELPELPEPFGFAEPTTRSPAFHFLRRQNEAGTGMFTAEQMRAYGEQCAKAERERAAKRCEVIAWRENHSADYSYAEECAAAIRAQGE
jgi:hypothetical protein